ncbi:hypothetical protein AOQ84DRAFT_260101, partial [Glonium stellatum]
SQMDAIRLNAAAILALAELPTIAERTALAGSSEFLECLILCPGLHKQQSATNLNKAEFPATAALTTGYVFRVENSATVHYLQRVGRTGHLTKLDVSARGPHPPSVNRRNASQAPDRPLLEPFPFLLHLSALLPTPIAIAILLNLQDWWACAVIAMLVLCRLLNIVVIRRRSSTFWAGASEPGVHGDLLILLSRDRWIRMRGFVDDLKAVTSGEWLRDPTGLESFAVNSATTLVYIAIVVSGNCSSTGSLVIILLLLTSAILLGASNILLTKQTMRDRVICVAGEPVKYQRRLDLAEQLIKETGRKDWAIGLGMI